MMRVLAPAAGGIQNKWMPNDESSSDVSARERDVSYLTRVTLRPVEVILRLGEIEYLTDL